MAAPMPLSTVLSQLSAGYDIVPYVDWGSTFQRIWTVTRPSNLVRKVQRYRSGQWEEIGNAAYWDPYSCLWQLAYDMSGFNLRIQHPTGYKYSYMQLFEVRIPSPPALIHY